MKSRSRLTSQRILDEKENNRKRGTHTTHRHTHTHSRNSIVDWILHTAREHSLEELRERSDVFPAALGPWRCWKRKPLNKFIYLLLLLLLLLLLHFPFCRYLYILTTLGADHRYYSLSPPSIYLQHIQSFNMLDCGQNHASSIKLSDNDEMLHFDTNTTRPFWWANAMVNSCKVTSYMPD